MYVDSLNTLIDGSEGLGGFSETGYETLVQAALNRVNGTVVGKAIFHIIRRYGYVAIVPSTDEGCGIGASTGYEDRTASWATRIGQRHLKVQSIQYVEFSPHFLEQGGSCHGQIPWDADEILAHELLHAARRLGGDDAYDDELTGYMSEYENKEEFFGILVGNIYSSETGRNDHLRSAHIGTDGLREALRDPDAWLRHKKHNYLLVGEFADTHYVTAPMMAKSKASFNPLRVYYDWKQRGYVPDTWTVKEY